MSWVQRAIVVQNQRLLGKILVEVSDKEAKHAVSPRSPPLAIGVIVPTGNRLVNVRP